MRARRWRATRRCGGCLAVFRNKLSEVPLNVRVALGVHHAYLDCRRASAAAHVGHRPFLRHKAPWCESSCVLVRAEFSSFSFFHHILERHLHPPYAMSKSRRRGRGRGRRPPAASRNSGINDIVAQEKAAADREFALMDRVYAFSGTLIIRIQRRAAYSRLCGRL